MSGPDPNIADFAAFFDAKLCFALLTPFSYVNDEPKRSEAK